jgi:hypothetical protein
LQKIEEQISDRAKKLGDVWLGVRVHANNDDQRNESVVGDDLGLLHGLGAPLLEALCHGFLIFSSCEPLEPLPLNRLALFLLSFSLVGRWYFLLISPCDDRLKDKKKAGVPWYFFFTRAPFKF